MQLGRKLLLGLAFVWIVTAMADAQTTKILGRQVVVVPPLFVETFNTTAAYDNTWAVNSSGGTVGPDDTTNPPVGNGGSNCGGFATEALKLTAGAFDQPSVWADIGAAQTGALYFRGYLYIASESISPSGSTAIILFSNTTAPDPNDVGTIRIELNETAGAQLQLTLYIGFGAAVSANVATGTCYLVELSWSATTPFPYELKMNGASIATGNQEPGANSTCTASTVPLPCCTGLATGTCGATEFIDLGVEDAASATIFWDSIAVSNTGFIGP